MVLKVQVSQFSEFDVEHTSQCLIPDYMMIEPYAFAKDFPIKERALLKKYTVQYDMGEEMAILILRNGNQTSEQIYINMEEQVLVKEIVKDKLYLKLSIIPRYASIYDTLVVSNGKETLTYTIDDFKTEDKRFRYLTSGKLVPWLEAYTVVEFDDKRLWLITTHGKGSYHLDKDNTYETINGVDFDLDTYLVRVNEYDALEDSIRVFHVDGEDFDICDEDADAAYRIASSIAQQCPEALDIIARYMEDAADLGSREAIDWLEDYHSDDGRFDAWS